MMGRPKTYDYPPNMTYDRVCDRYIVRHPTTKKTKKFASEAEARKVVEKLNELLANEKRVRGLTSGLPMIDGLVAKWLEDRLQFQPWSPGTRANNVAKMKRIQRELGRRPISHTDCLFIDEWLSQFCKTADTYNDWRYVFFLLWDFAVFRKLATENEGAKLLERSTSKKLEMNRKQRQPLDLDGFKLIHAKAEPWLQLAMEYSLVTLLSRQEICDMRHENHRGGYLYVIRQKVSGESDMAFIRIAIDSQLEELRSRSRALDDTVSPYIIHRKPKWQRREWMDSKPHWTAVMPDYLTKAFEAARDSVPKFAIMAPGTRPSFHEVRGLGMRILESQGVDPKRIQALATHSTPKTTRIYLDGGAEALTDDDYLPVTAPLRLRDVL